MAGGAGKSATPHQEMMGYVADRGKNACSMPTSTTRCAKTWPNRDTASRNRRPNSWRTIFVPHWLPTPRIWCEAGSGEDRKNSLSIIGERALPAATPAIYYRFGFARHRTRTGSRMTDRPSFVMRPSLGPGGHETTARPLPGSGAVEAESCGRKQSCLRNGSRPRRSRSFAR